MRGRGIATACICAAIITGALIARNERRPEIYIVRERAVTTYDKGTALMVEYSVDGIMSNAVFYLDEEDGAERFIEYLATIGTINFMEGTRDE